MAVALCKLQSLFVQAGCFSEMFVLN